MDRGYRAAALVIDRPEWFERGDFLDWLDEWPMTMRAPGAPVDEWCDTFVGLEPDLLGEGDGADMPHDIWEAIVEAARQAYPSLPAHIGRVFVRITNCD